jgi:hypothetical protein
LLLHACIRNREEGIVIRKPEAKESKFEPEKKLERCLAQKIRLVKSAKFLFVSELNEENAPTLLVDEPENENPESEPENLAKERRVSRGTQMAEI